MRGDHAVTGAARSLTQQEAEQRAALLEVSATTSPSTSPTCRGHRRALRLHGHLHAAASPAPSTFLDCCADVVTATLNGEPLAPAEDGRIALPDLRADNVLVVESVQATPPTARACTRPSTRPTARSTSGCPSSPTRPAQVWACFDQPDLKAPHAFTVTAPARVDGGQQQRRRRRSRTSRARAAGPSRPPRRCRRTTRWSTPARSTRSAARVGGYDLGLFARRSLAAVLERDADELFTSPGRGWRSSARSSRCRSRSRSTTRSSCPSSAARWRTTAASPGPTPSSPGCRRPRPSGSCSPRSLLHEMAHMWFGNIVTMRWWDDLWLNEAFAEFAANWALVEAPPATPTPGPATSPTTSCRPTSPTRARARTRSASRSPTSRRRPPSSTRSPTPRAPRSSTS